MSNDTPALQYRTYRVARRLGEGAMGAVYQAVDEQLQVTVALKVAHEGKRRGELLGRLRNEADVLGRLVDPQVVRLLDLFEEGDDFVLVMEYVDGPDILAWSRGRGTHEVLRMLARVCDAVAAVHAVGFVHLDLKPANILVLEDSVKLLDFGTAWRLEGDPSTVPMGTPHYMSTEHARLKIEGTGKVDVRSDLYSLGAILYTLCTGGAVPFAAPEEALLATVVSFPPTDPRVYNPSLPQPLVDLVMRLLQKPARARHGSTHELRDAILDLVKTLPDAPLVPAEVGPVEVYQAPSPHQVSALLEGRFHILQKAGSGAFASVYEAVEIATGTRWALKVVNAGAPDSPEHRRFQREARALERLSHPNVAAYGTHFVREGIGFLTMEYVEGTDLTSLRGAPIEEIAWLGVQLCRGLAAAHEHHVIHRDLKPQNVRVTPEGVLKIVDFGLSRLMDALSALTLTGSEFAGTLGYCAPEGINTRPNARFDLFSAGVILYELTAGHMPYAQGLEYINQYLRGEEAQPRPIERKIPPGLRKILEGLVQFDPALRTPTSARELEQQLADLGMTSDRPADPGAASPVDSFVADAPRAGTDPSGVFDSGDAVLPSDVWDSVELRVVVRDAPGAVTERTLQLGGTRAEGRQPPEDSSGAMRSPGESGETVRPTESGPTDPSGESGGETVRPPESRPGGVRGEAVRTSQSGPGGVPGESGGEAVRTSESGPGGVRVKSGGETVRTSESGSGDVRGESGGETLRPRGTFDSGETVIPRARPVLDSTETAAVTPGLLDSGEIAPPVPRAGQEPAPSGMFGSGEMAAPLAARGRRSVRRFFGRSEEVDELLDLVHAQGSRGRAAIVSGPAGIGRTRLLNAVGRLASASGRVRWIPVAVPPGGTRGRSSARQLERLVLSALQARSSGDTESLLRGLAGSQTVVLAIDDAHQLDDSAVSRLIDLGTRLADRPFLIVAAFRTDRGTDRARTAAVAARLGATELALAGLDLTASESLLRDRLGLPLSKAFAQRLHERTAGNPAHLLSVLASTELQVTDNETLDGAQGQVQTTTTASIPAILAEQVEDLLADLPANALAGLRALTLVDAPFSKDLAAAALAALLPADEAAPAHPEILATKGPVNAFTASPVARISGPEDSDFDDEGAIRPGSVLEVLVGGGILLEEEGLFRFPSPLFRDAVARTLEAATDTGFDRARVHTSIAHWLEEAGQEYEAALHYEQAGKVEDEIRALQKAGAREDSPVSRRIQAFERLLPRLEATNAPPHLIAKCVIDSGTLTRGRSATEGMNLLYRGYALAELSGDPVTRALVRCELAKGLQHTNSVLADQEVHEALAILPQPETDSQRWHKAYAYVMKGHLSLQAAQLNIEHSTELREAGEEAWRAAEAELAQMVETKDTLLSSIIALYRGLQLLREQLLNEARREFMLAASLAKEGGHALQYVSATINLLVLIIDGEGTPEEGRSLYRIAAPLLERLGHHYLANLHRDYAILLMNRTSEWKDVEPNYLRALSIHQQTNKQSEVYLDLLNLSELFILQRKFEEAHKALLKAWTLDNRPENRMHGHLLRLYQGMYDLHDTIAGPNQAQSHLREALLLSEATGNLTERSSLEATLALSIASVSGCNTEVLQLLHCALNRAAHKSSTAARVHRLWGQCVLVSLRKRNAVNLLPLQERKEVIAHFQEGLRLSIESQYGVEEAYCRGYLGVLFADGIVEHERIAQEHNLRARELRARLGALSLPSDELSE